MEKEFTLKINEGLSLLQNADGLVFGTDAYLLSAFVGENKKAKAVDLGSGTGVIALLLSAKQKVKEITCIEIQKSFCDLIEKNIALNGFETIKVLNADVREISQKDLNGEVGLVVANPPYRKLGSGKEPPQDAKNIACFEVNGGLNEFASCAEKLLKTGGKFAFVYLADRLDEVFASLQSHRLAPKRLCFVHADTESAPSLVLCEAIKDGKNGVKILPPLFLYEKESKGEKNRPLTEQAQQIYNTGKWYE